MHRADCLHELVDVGLRDIAVQVLADLLLVEGQKRQDQIVFASLVFAPLTVEKGELLLDGPKVLCPAGQEEARARILLL